MQPLAITLQTRYASIEVPVSKAPDNTSIALPKEIANLITGPDYWVRAKTNRYKMLIREGHLDKLMHLAKMAHERATEQPPAHWFAKACSKARWEKYTLPYFAKLAEISKKAQMVAHKLGIEVNKFILKQVWHGVAVERYAAIAQEVGKSPAKYFAWLCKHSAELASE